MLEKQKPCISFLKPVPVHVFPSFQFFQFRPPLSSVYQSLNDMLTLFHVKVLVFR